MFSSLNKEFKFEFLASKVEDNFINKEYIYINPPPLEQGKVERRTSRGLVGILVHPTVDNV